MEVIIVKAAAKILTLLFCLSIMFLSYQSEASSTPAKKNTAPEKWEYYASDEEGNGYFYDTDNVEHLKGNHVTVWVQTIYPESHPKYSTARFQWELNCSKKKMRGLQAYAKKKDGTSTTVTESSDWSVIPAESTAETLYEAVCKKPGKKTDDKKIEDKKTEDKKTEENKSEMKTP
jgi:hypothetical protein